MFKLESYVTPWLLGYLDQYVKLRPEDLQLSLWGGDAVLYNLDLRLDVLQKAMHLPIVFKSGHIHELRLHVPWTKLGSEPMVITINTVECIVKVRDFSDTSSSASSSSVSKTASASSRRRKLKRQPTEDLPPGYLQSILNRVVNNVTFIVNNMILKFVEDDIVLSVNVKSAECYSCDQSWNRAFVDITPEDLALRRMVHFSDLTVCLDKTNADGHIENYQEPMLYRCFLTCRLHMMYDSIHAKVPAQTKLNILCEKLDGLISDTQLPMFLRLIELCLALYYGYLDVAPPPEREGESTKISPVQESSLSLADEGEREEEEEEEGGEGDQGWVDWMWSMVPQILPEEEEMEGGYHRNKQVDRAHILSIGFYIQQASLTFKVTELQKEKGHVRGQKFTYHPFLVLEATGIGVEILVQGLTFLNVQCGIGHITLASVGPCICGHSADSSSQEAQILRCGAENKDADLPYDWGSLFDPSCAQNRGRPATYVVDREEHLRVYTEQNGQLRFPAFWVDYLSTLVLPQSSYSGSQSSDSDFGDSTLFQQEASMCRFVFGSSRIQLTSSSVHRIHKLLCCMWNHHYEPYRKHQEKKDTGERVQLTEAQLAGLEECIPTCSYHVTLLRPTIRLTAASHPVCNVATKLYSTHSSRRSKNKLPPATEGAQEEMVELWVSAERFDLQIVSPMYPGRLVKLVSNIAGPSSNLMYHCQTHTQLKVFSLQAGLQRPARKGAAWRPVVLLPPCSFAFYFRHLLLPHLWNNSHLSLWEHSYEVPQVTMTVSKASVLAAVQLLSSWTHPQSARAAHRLSLMSDLFPAHNEETSGLSVLELSVCGLEVRGCHTALVQAYTGSLSSLQLLLYTPAGTEQGEAGTVPVLYGPVDSSPVMEKMSFQQQPVSCLMEGAECVAFTVQIPHHTSTTEAPAILMVSMEGLAGCVDPALLHWFSYTPKKQPLRTTSTSDPSAVAAAVDVPLAKATSPLQPGSSQMSVRSGSSHTQPTTSRLFSHSHTPSHTLSLMGSMQQQAEPPHKEPVSSLDSLTKLLTAAFPLIRMMHVQVDVKSSCVFVPKKSVSLAEASGDIAANVQTAWQRGVVEEVVVVCLPTVSVHSVASSTMDVLQDIPITTLHGGLLSEKLPWTVEMSDWKAYTLHTGGGTQSVVGGLGVSSTVGATVHYNPPTSDIIQSLALCLHVDFQPLCVSLSHSQVGTLSRLMEVATDVGGAAWQLAEHCMHQLIPKRYTSQQSGGADPDRDGSGSVPGEQGNSHTQPEASVTGGTPDVAEAVTTDVSDEVSHASPLHTMVTSEMGDDAAVKLSIWLQCVLPRFTLVLFSLNNAEEVSVGVEDLALSCDIQQVYSKLKASIGSIHIHRYHYSDSGERVKDTTCPFLFSTSRELPQSVYIHNNKGWSPDRQTVPERFPPQETFSSDNMHGFFSLTLTRALCRSVHKKMRKMNVDLTSLSDREDSPAGDGLYFHQFVSEVCIRMEPVDAVIHFPSIKHVLSLWQAWSGVSPKAAQLHLTRDMPKPRQNKTSSSLLASHTLPLLYIDIAAVRLFIPIGETSSINIQDSSTASTLNHDFLLVQWGSMHVQPYADNPLPRYPVHRDLFHQALQCGMTQQTGSCVEDRQYQLTLHCLALSSGAWGDLVDMLKAKSSHSTKGSSGVQIPALEWNNYLGHRPAEKELEVIPIVTAFDLCLVVAPPIVYTGMTRQQPVLVCGVTAELNVVSDLDLHLSAQQLSLMTTTADMTMALSHRSATGSGGHHDNVSSQSVGVDSGVASDISTATCPVLMESGIKEKQENVSAQVPANVLLTAGRISMTFYTHVCLESDLTIKLAPASSSSQTSPKKHDARKITNTDNFASLIRGMPDVAERGGNEGDCVAFDFLQPRIDGSEDMRVTRGTVCVRPFVYMYIAQPHTVLSTWPQADRLELSCYDILLKGVQPDHIFPVTKQRVMPDLADFSVNWIETRAGCPDSKTGIPPCLLTLRVSGLLSMPGDFEVKLERPIKVSITQDTLTQVTSLLHHMAPAVPSRAPEEPKTSVRGQSSGATASDTKQSVDQLQWVSGMMGVVRRASLQTEQVVVSVDCQDATASSGLVTSVTSIAMAVEQVEKTDTSAKVQGSMNWKDVVVKTAYNKTLRLLAGPFTVDTDLLMRWPGKGQTTPLQAVLGMQSGLLFLQLGQEHVMCLRHLVSAFQSKTNDSSSPPKKKQMAEKKPHSEATRLTSQDSSHDDLRSGMFVFIHNEEDGGEWPAPYQAVISGGEDDGEMDSCLTWAYPEPRCVTTLSTLPVPLGLLYDTSQQESSVVTCQLQYWNECVEEFVIYATFELCGDSNISVELPQLHLASISSLAVSNVWRVVVCRPSDPSLASEQTEEKSMQSRNSRDSVLLAAQLAGSMCVDSAQVSQLVPSLQVSLAVGKIQLHLYNHLMYNGTGGSGQLRGYRLSGAVPQDQQWGVVTVDKVSVVSSHFSGPLSRSALQVGCEAGLEVVDYSTLTMQSLVDPVDLSASLCLQHYLQPCATKVDVNTSPLHVHVGRSALHTINTSAMAWAETICGQFGESSTVDSGLLFGHLILCNNTQQTLRCGQAGTDENILLQSGHMFPYSWRSYSSKQHLHFCLDHPTWRWCAPIDISSEGHCVRVVRARDQRYTLLVQVTQLSPIHKKITVSGQFLVCSRLSQDVEVRFLLRDGEEEEREQVWVVGAGRSSASLVAEHEDMKGVGVRLAGYQLPWSHTLHLSGHAMHTNQLLKVLLPDGSSYFHMWCRIFSQNFNETRQKLIFLSPLYVLRSHLPLPLHARLFTPHSKQQQTLEVTGQGQEYQLHCTGGDVTHQLSFKLGPDMVESSPPVVLSSGLVDQVEQTALAEVNIESLCQHQVPSLTGHWPYNLVQPCSVSEGKQWSEVDQAGVDVNVQLSQYLPGCNTLLVDISPWCLLTNLTPLPLLLLTDTHRLKLPQGCTVAPPAVQELRVGCEGAGQVWETPPIPLSEDEVEQHLYSPDLGRVLFLDGQVQVQLLLPPATPGGLTQVVPLSVVSILKHKIRVVTISERLRVTNVSGLALQTQLMAVPHSSSKMRCCDFKIQPSPLPASHQSQRRCTTALLDWQLLHDDPVGMEALELVLYMTFRTLSPSDESSALWSTPVRIACGPQGSRNTVALNGEDGSAGGVSVCVTCAVEGALTYVVISRDNSPMCWIHNLCPFPLQYGQGLNKVALKGVTVQEETELVEAVPVVSSQKWTHYTMPHLNTTFPQLDTASPPRLHVRPLLAADSQSADAASSPVCEWSSGILLEPGDSFLHMSGMEHIKVHIEVLAMVYHVTFSLLSKAEVSAREVRSRIQGGQTVTRVEETVPQPLPASQGTMSGDSVQHSGEESSSVEAVRESLAVHGEGWPSLTMGVMLEALVVTLHDDVSQTSRLSQLMQMEVQSLLVVCYPVGGSSSSLCVALCAHSLQVDNVLAHQGFYDFPVILQPQQTPPSLEVSLAPHKDLTEVHAMLRASSMLHVQFVLSKDRLLPAGWFLDSVEIAVKPLSVFFEDTFFFRLYEECLCLLPHLLREGGSRRRQETVPQDVWERARLHQQPLRIRHMCIHPVSLLLSVHASVRLFLATDHAPLSLRGFERHNLFTGTQQLAYTFAMHYITSAIFRAGMVVGSMDILGSPTGLVRCVSAGLTDLLRLPYQGLTRSPAAFATGLFGGVSSLMRNVTAGVMTSVTNFASSVSRNMDRLSLDSGHQQRQEESRRQRPSGLSSGLQQGLTGFGLSLLGAVAGLVDQPLQSVLSQQSEERPASATRRAGSIMAGVGKGLVGVITKPIGGAAELLSQTGQGFLQGSGLRKKVVPRHSIAEILRSDLPTAWLKYPMKMLGESPLLLAVQGLQQDGMGEGAEVVLLLTGDMVAVVGEEEDGQQQAFALSQLHCHSPAPAILVLTVTDAVFQVPAQMENPNSRDRVAAFIKSAANESVEGAVWSDDRQSSPVAEDDSRAHCVSPVTTDAELPEVDSRPPAPSYHFRVDPHWSQLFMALFHIASNRQMGRGFSV